MSEQVHFEESLSALMDNEAGELEMHRILKQLSENPEVREKWHRYQIARAALHRELPEHLIDVSDRVHIAIENEKSSHLVRRWFYRAVRPLGRMAVAASVAVLAVTGVQQYQLLDEKKEPNASVLARSTPPQDDVVKSPDLPFGFVLPPLNTRSVSAGTRPVTGNTRQVRVIMSDAVRDRAMELKVQNYLNDLMLRHAEHAALNTNQGLMPFARISRHRHEEQ